MALNRGQKALAGTLISLVGLGVAVARCRSCRERLQKFMMTKMSRKMPHMMEKFFGGLAKDDQLEMASHCKSMFAEMEEKLKKESS